jgi:spoIIIJ-associated protein
MTESEQTDQLEQVDAEPTTQDQSTDEQSTDEQSTDEQSTDEQSTDEQSTDEQTDGQPAPSADGQSEEEQAGAEGEPRQDQLEHEGDIAADYLEELLDIADLDGDLDMDVEGDRAVVSIVGAELHQLVGENGRVLDALQELTRLAVYRETGERSRLMLDVSGHRATRRRELEELAASTIAEVRDSGERAALRPMTPFERKVVHDAVAAAGLTSESEGVEPRRYVVILPG